MPKPSPLNMQRMAILQQRQQLSSATQKSASVKMAQHIINSEYLASAKSIAAFIAFNGEINPEYILSDAATQHATIYMPVVQNNFKMLFAPYTSNSKLIPNRYQMPEPEHRIDDLVSAAEIDIILTPLLAFDSQGNRLGMGAGYYDRALAIRKTQTKPLLIGLAYEFQKQESLVANDWDIPMDMVATEAQLYQFTTPSR
jgi:5-formyltetrahydrofolate cyclo-ligase